MAFAPCGDELQLLLGGGVGASRTRRPGFNGGAPAPGRGGLGLARRVAFTVRRSYTPTERWLRVG